MNTQLLTNTIVKAAIEAWQQGDAKAWMGLFTEDAKLYDDGEARNFYHFSTEIIGHERFTSIDKVENNGLYVYGHFHTDQWGDFKKYFFFTINGDNKITRLDIGQASY